uniref:XPC complex subunit, DNA damage recognition and repair factor n=1 Tax=Leptobrachium leishanense TaxID=445787 RepID=A0A8C5Q6F4_9ANUR
MGKRRGSVEAKPGVKQARRQPTRARRGSQARAARGCDPDQSGTRKRQGSVDAETSSKPPRKQPIKRRRGGSQDVAAAPRASDWTEDVFEDGPTKKRKPTAPGVKTIKAVKADAADASPSTGPRKQSAKTKKPIGGTGGELKNEDEIRNLLHLEKVVPDTPGEGGSGSEEDSEDEWEDVEELNGPVVEDLQAAASPELEFAAQPVEIEIETAEAARKRLRREKRKAEFEGYLRRMMNRFSKELREDTHKVHLLCLLANGLYRSHTCREPDLLAIALSVVPVKFTTSACVDMIYLKNLLTWFVGTFTFNAEMSVQDKEPLASRLERRFGVYGVRDEEEMVHVLLVILRALSLRSRLVLSLQPIPLKEPPAKNKRPSDQTASKSPNKTPAPKKPPKATPRKNRKKVKQEATSPGESEEEEKPTRSSKTGEHKDRKKVKQEVEEKPVRSGVAGECKDHKQEVEEKPVRSSVAGERKDHKKVKPEVEEMPGTRPKNLLRRKVASKVSYKEESVSVTGSDSDFSFSDSDSDDSYSEDTSFERKVRVSTIIKEKSMKKLESMTGHHQKSKRSPSDSSARPQRRGKIISTDEEEEPVVSPTQGSDQWVEVYLEKDGRWVTVDCVHKTVGHPQLCYKNATKPLTYVIAIDNVGCVKDVTRRYDAQWMTNTRKRRVDEDWWEETLKPYKIRSKEQEEKEDAEFEAKMLEQPLPTSITEYKNHPLYVLKRHLLKYEAIYPETAAILGFCRGEAVYARSCVHTLHSRDTWLKEARVARLGEVPYKMVKGQSNRARKARLADPEKKDSPDLALYGLWQTEDYQPPVAVDGKVPRNEFGNVYLFKPSMLPIGCSHLRVPNLHRVARKLDIDCVPAITGFDFHCGFSHPVTDGYIVCEENADVLLAAWDNDQAEMERKQKEKRERRALGNWKLLIKGLLIRERLKARYGKKDLDKTSSTAEDRGFSSDEDNAVETLAQDVMVSWPQNREAAGGNAKPKSKREQKGADKHLFPFEKM